MKYIDEYIEMRRRQRITMIKAAIPGRVIAFRKAGTLDSLIRLEIQVELELLQDIPGGALTIREIQDILRDVL